ncbi:urease subunit beta [Flavobacterium aquidurense]|uniref:Urease subunit beta n=1 Tax=Flavobacterium aquidurense TaxID=362413 RepID=A0A0Q0S794_9FLAO|nr:urease subunit beta [Flavobacterium aquidurense]KQB39394.1 Urease subunit beta [Flavobacterium aquidurense]
MIPGEIFIKEGDIILNEYRETTSIKVVNTGDRPIQIGSHFHFFEVNKAMEFDRKAAFCMRLNIPAGTAVRFEPGEHKEVNLVKIGGNRKIIGLNNLVNGDANSSQNKKLALQLVDKLNFKTISK